MIEATADLHCHSSASGPNGNWWYAQLQIADCKTPPEDVYAQAKAAGMSFVTLTDHDTIEVRSSSPTIPTSSWARR